MHGGKTGRGRKKMSDNGMQLREKQKLRRQYGIMEGQFSLIFEEALRRPGVTGETMLQLIELRLDNVAYRLGWAPSRRAARQLVLHGHVAVNGRKCAIPSRTLRVGDAVTVRERPRSKDMTGKAIEAAPVQPPQWLSADTKALRGEVVSVPTREQIAPIVNEQAIVELYSR
jgi:small subunit ribosomal protein S4